MKLRMTLIEMEQHEAALRTLVLVPAGEMVGASLANDRAIRITLPMPKAAPFALFEDYIVEITAAAPEEPAT